MPVALGDLGQREPRCSRTRRSRGPTRSSAAAIAVGIRGRCSVSPCAIAPRVPGISNNRCRHEHASRDDCCDGMSEYDVVVVGGGAAGLSAALVLTRARRRVAVVDAGQPRNAPAAHMQASSAPTGCRRPSCSAAGRAEVAGYGGHLIAGTVTDHRPPARRATSAGRFEVDARGRHRRCATRRVLVTTGLRDEIPDIPGVRERWGRDLLHCPYCHGYEVRDQPLGVLGGTPEARRSTRTSSASGPTTSSSSPTATLDRRRARTARRPGHRRRRRTRSPGWSSRTTS